jgi:ABC-2 type transport system permease protein
MMKSLNNVMALVGREIKSYFLSPIAYVTLMLFLLLTGYFFYAGLIEFRERLKYFQNIAQVYRNPEIMSQINLNSTVIANVLFNMIFVFLFIIPLLTMRSFAEERKNKTEELLMTSPVTINQIIAGKFFGAFTFLLIMLLPTVIYQVLLFKFASPEIGPVITGYIGVILFVVVGVSIGIFTSSLTENQIIAAVVSFVILLFLFIISMLGAQEGTILTSIVDYLSVISHIRNFIKGLIDLKDIIYFATLAAFFIFLTKRSVESIRWR